MWVFAISPRRRKRGCCEGVRTWEKEREKLHSMMKAAHSQRCFLWMECVIDRPQMDIVTLSVGRPPDKSYAANGNHNSPRLSHVDVDSDRTEMNSTNSSPRSYRSQRAKCAGKQSSTPSGIHGRSKIHWRKELSFVHAVLCFLTISNVIYSYHREPVTEDACGFIVVELHTV